MPNEDARPTLLLVDDDRRILQVLAAQLERQNYTVITASSSERALAALARAPICLALVDYHLPDMTGIELTRRIKQMAPHIAVIAITGQGNPKVAMQMLREGAIEYFEKPLKEPDRLYDCIRKAVAAQEGVEFGAQLKKLPTAPGLDPERGVNRIVGNSAATRELRLLVDRYSRLPASEPLLLLGPTGVGKTHTAQAFHESTAQSAHAFIELNCAAMDLNTLDRVLFGNEAFTGVGRDTGACAEVGKGTLFLDEIGELPFHLQARLLKLVDQRIYTRSGGHKTESFEGRLVLATNRDLAVEVQEKRFREDLYHRVNQFPVRIPALRDRPEDIPLLAYYFTDHYSREFRRRIERITPGAMDMLRRGAWAGNVRGLAKVIKRAIVYCEDGAAITEELLRVPMEEEERASAPLDTPPPAATPAPTPAPAQRPPRSPQSAPALVQPPPQNGLYDDIFTMEYNQAKDHVLHRFTVAYLEHRLQEANGNITLAATNSGMLRPNFSKKMKQFGVDKPTTRLGFRVKRRGDAAGGPDDETGGP